MFSLPRDTSRRADPAGTGPLVLGPRRTANKINSFFANNRRRSDLWPGNDRTRGYNALKAVLGELYDLDIKYFVEVNFEGFKKVVDAVGGVTINVQVPVVDDAFPGRRVAPQRLYIPSGIQHMDGEQALRYARSRNTSTDFDRGARQQRVLLSLREQADPQILLPRLPELVERAQVGRPDRHPARPARRAARPGLGGRHREHPLVRLRAAAVPERQCCQALLAATSSRLDRIQAGRQATRSRATRRPGPAGALAGEGAGVWVLNGTRLSEPRVTPGRLPRVPRPRRVRAAPGKPEGQVPADTVITVYNGAEAEMPRDDRLPREAVRGQGQDGRPTQRCGPTSSSSIGRDTPDLEPPPRPERSPRAGRRRALLDRGQPVLVLGQPTADRVEVAVADQPGDRARPRPSRPCGGRPR